MGDPDRIIVVDGEITGTFGEIGNGAPVPETGISLAVP